MAHTIDLGTLIIEKIIVHDIPRHKKNEEDTEPKLSQATSDLPNALRSFFREKILSALRSDKSLKVSFKIQDDEGTVQELTKRMSENDDSFIHDSQEIARHLFRIQVGNNAGGILLIIQAKVNSCRAIIVMKLERDSGAQLSLNQETSSFDIVEVQDLMLTQKTRIFKVALLFDREIFQVDFDGQVTDYQINIKQKMKATSFFIDDFLGCEASAEPKVYTQRFYKHTRDFIDQTDDSVLKTKYINDLNSYVQNNDKVIVARKFAEQFLESAEEKDRYKKYLQTVSFPFESTILKDTHLITSQIRKISVDFTNGVSIVGTQGVLDDNVTIEKHGLDRHKAEIISKIKNVK